MKFDPKPCPFCAEDQRINLVETTVPIAHGERQGYRVTCKSCHTRGPFSHDQFQALTFWNNRQKEN